MNTKPKRTHPFFDTNKNQDVWFYTYQSPTVYIVCDKPGFPVDAHYYEANTSDLREVKKKVVSSISSVPKSLTDKAISDKKAMNEFFTMMESKIPFNCQNCGMPLYAYSKTAKRSVTAHLLPKAHFPSIKTDTDNIAFMGADYINCPCNCHDRYDSSIEIRITMPIYDFALKQFYKMKHKLSSEEIKRAYEYLNIQWELENLQENDLKNIKRHGISNNDI